MCDIMSDTKIGTANSMNLEKIMGHCEHNGKLQYRTMIPKEDASFVKGEKAYCIVEADACPFVYISRNKYYCRNKVIEKSYGLK